MVACLVVFAYFTCSNSWGVSIFSYVLNKLLSLPRITILLDKISVHINLEALKS